jgi:hypothetical protein
MVRLPISIAVSLVVLEGCGAAPASHATVETTVSAIPAPSSAPSASASPVASSTKVAPPPTKALATKEECRATIRAGAKLHDAGKYDDAIKTYREGLERCGPGNGFLGEIGYSLAAKGDFDGAADQYLAEVLVPGAPKTTFGNLAQSLAKLSPAKLRTVTDAGTRPEAPVFVPEIGAEYFWAENIACGVPGGVSDSQALVEHEKKQLDLLDIQCPDGSKRKVYFDFSADPQEQQMRKELGR